MRARRIDAFLYKKDGPCFFPKKSPIYPPICPQNTLSVWKTFLFFVFLRLSVHKISTVFPLFLWLKSIIMKKAGSEPPDKSIYGRVGKGLFKGFFNFQ